MSTENELIVNEPLDELCLIQPNGRPYRCMYCGAQLYVDETKWCCQDCRTVIVGTNQRAARGEGRRNPKRKGPEYAPSPPNVYRVRIDP